MTDGKNYFYVPGENGDDWGESEDPVVVDGENLTTIVYLAVMSVKKGTRIELTRVK